MGAHNQQLTIENLYLLHFGKFYNEILAVLLSNFSQFEQNKINFGDLFDQNKFGFGRDFDLK